MNPKTYSQTYKEKMRKGALDKVGKGKIECINCGCDFIPILEINHVDGGGRKERTDNPNYRGSGFHNHIISGKRGVNDLELRCSVCNDLHYIELKYGKLPFKVIWNK